MVTVNSESDNSLSRTEILTRLTQLVYASWLITSEDGKESEAIPSGQGPIDYAIRDLVRGSMLPDWAASEIGFEVTDTGLMCSELSDIRSLANRLGITSDPNPSYTRTEVVVDKGYAQICLNELDIDEDSAKRLGERFRGLLADYAERFAAS